MKDAGFTPTPSKNTGAKGSTPATRTASQPLGAPNACKFDGHASELVIITVISGKRGSPLTPAGTVAPRNLQMGGTGGIPLNVSYASGSSVASDWPSTPNLTSPTLDSVSSSESQSLATPADDDASTVYIGTSEFGQAMSNLGVEDEFGEEDGDDIWAAAAPGVVAETIVEDEPVVNLWPDYGKEGPKEENVVFLCPSHGKLCSKGICADRDEADKKQKKEELERKKREDRVKKEVHRPKNRKDKKAEEGESIHLFDFKWISIFILCLQSQKTFRQVQDSVIRVWVRSRNPSTLQKTTRNKPRVHRPRQQPKQRTDHQKKLLPPAMPPRNHQVHLQQVVPRGLLVEGK